MKNSFYENTKQLDQLKIIKEPKGEDIEKTLSYIIDEKYAYYFFYNLENPGWIEPLYKVGYFYNLPEVKEVEKGKFQAQPWPAGDYLLKFANEYEEIVCSIITNVQTKNWVVIDKLVKLLIKISPVKAASVVSTIDDWLGSQCAINILPVDLLPLADSFVDSGLLEAALNMLNSIIKPILFESKSSSFDPKTSLRFRSDNYWVYEYYSNQFQKLSHLVPEALVKIFSSQLQEAINLLRQYKEEDIEEFSGFYWRFDIPSISAQNENLDTYDLLINGLRDSLIAICKHSTESGEAFVTDSLSSNHIIFQRIALYVLRQFGNSYSDLINQSFLNKEFFEKREFKSEYKGLLRDQFKVASIEVQNQVITWILSGPSDIDKLTNWYAQRKSRTEISDKDRQNAKNRWIHEYLSIIGGELPYEANRKLLELDKKYGKKDTKERPLIEFGPLQSAVSPITSEELAKKTFEELHDYFLSFLPKDTFLDPREPLAQDFKLIVQNNPDRFVNFASHLIDEKMQYLYIYNYLSGLAEALSNNKSIKINLEVLNLCNFLINKRDNPLEKQDGEYRPNLLVAQRAVANLLNEILRSSDPYLSREMLDQIRGMLITLANHVEPVFEKEKESGLDPYTQSINSIRSIAMHGLMNYSLYVIRQNEKLYEGKKKERYIEEEVLKVFDEKLDKTKDPSYAVHAVFGAYFTQLHYLNREWVEGNLSKIFPKEEENIRYWKAAWDAYILCSNLFKSIFTLLIPQYKKGVLWFSNPKFKTEYFGSSPDERFAQHIMAAYINNLSNFNDENQVIELFFDNAPDEIRANGIYWLSGFLEKEKPNSTNEIWMKLWDLWKKRIEDLKEGKISNPSHEISVYMRWLENCPVDLGTLFDTLNESIKFLTNDYYSKLLVTFAAKESNSYPLQAVTILQGTIFNEKEPWWRSEDKDEEAILTTALKSKDQKAKQIAIDVINFRGENGDFRWKDLIY